MKTLNDWIEQLAKTFSQTRGISITQRESYRTALADLSIHELQIGCDRALRTWNFANLLPPPSFIRECVAAAMEEENFLRKPSPRITTDERLSLEDAWDDWEYTETYAKKLRETLGTIARLKRFETLPLSARRAQLKNQAEEILKRYGQRETVRVRGAVPSETNGAKQGPEIGNRSGTENDTGGERPTGGDAGGARDPGKSS